LCRVPDVSVGNAARGGRRSPGGFPNTPLASPAGYNRSMPTGLRLQAVVGRHFFLPQEHGAWIWWIGPLLLGLAAVRRWSPDVAWLGLSLLAGFLLRQPATILVKARVGRRPKSDAGPAAAWVGVYATLLLGTFALLVTRGHTRLAGLAIPGIAVFAWHMALVARREERGQMGVELVGAGVLALAAPAAYWVAAGTDPFLPWLLWGLCWLQSAASIVLVYYRLSLRKMEAAPPSAMRLRLSRRSLTYHGFNAAIAVLLAAVGRIPWLMAAGFALMLVDAIDGVARPPIGVRPTRIGLRQLLASSLFVLLAAAGFLSIG